MKAPRTKLDRSGSGTSDRRFRRPQRTLEDLIIFAAELSGMPKFRWVQAEGLSRKHSRMKRVQVWSGSEGALGYFCYLGLQHESKFARMLEMLLKHNPTFIVPQGNSDEEPISLRAELERRGINVKYFLSELIGTSSAKNKRDMCAELERQGLHLDESMIELIDELIDDRA